MTSCSQKFKNVPVCLPAVMGNRKSSHFRKLLIFLTLKKKKKSINYNSLRLIFCRVTKRLLLLLMCKSLTINSLVFVIFSFGSSKKISK